MKAATVTDERENNLDFIRLVAASLVLFSHCYPLTASHSAEPIGWLTGYESGGGLAVAVFFVISGYLITPSYLNSRSVFEYLAKRASRIFPALIVAVSLTVVTLCVFSSKGISGYFSSSSTYAYMSNILLDVRFNLPGVFEGNAYPNTVNGSLWTLPFEAIMYVVVLALGRLSRLNLRDAAIAAFVSFVIFVVAARHPRLGGVVLLGIAHLVDVMKLVTFYLMGSLLYFVRRRFPISPAFALISMLLIVATFGTRTGQYIYVLLLPAVIIYVAHVRVPVITGFGKHGDISYGMYIYAFPVQQTVVYLFGNSITVGSLFVRAICITIPLSILSWKFVEAPVLSRVRLHIRRRRAVQDAQMVPLAPDNAAPAVPDDKLSS